MLKNICPDCLKEFRRTLHFCTCGKPLMSAYDHEIDALASRYREQGVEAISSHLTKNLEKDANEECVDNTSSPSSSTELHDSFDANRTKTLMERQIRKGRMWSLLWIVASLVVAFIYGARAWKSTKRER